MNLDVVTSSYKVTGYLTGSENGKGKDGGEVHEKNAEPNNAREKANVER